MDEQTAVVDWTRVLIEYGPMVGGLLGLSLVFAPLVVWISRGHDRALLESTRLSSRVQYYQARATERLARAVQRGERTQAAVLEAIRAQPARYALEKDRAANGGWTREELEERRKIVEKADRAMSAVTAEREYDLRTEDPDETIDEQINRLRLEAEIASSESRRQELLRRARMLEAQISAV